eukprot:TRINITY_DN35093_c0_g1_i1.p1 TRINITY_DN35093_c0_g1~~TRINITY_DN35093_c0_g1_i1.p1  ORF type:complete len:213 (+),score=9.69 TRINITY_DN35093_c0_g1_i1:235-873(+)
MNPRASFSLPHHRGVVALLLAIFASVPQGAWGGGCGNFTATDGSKYILDPLTLADDYVGFESVNPPQFNVFRWNFCAPVNTQCSTFSNARVTQTAQNGICVPSGYEPISFGDHPDGPGKGVVVTYVNEMDSQCLSGQVSRTTKIIVGCGTSNWTLDGISESTVTRCMYEIRATSKHACRLHGTGKSSASTLHRAAAGLISFIMISSVLLFVF